VKYRKKPIVIEAEQWTLDPDIRNRIGLAIMTWENDTFGSSALTFDPQDGSVSFRTLEGIVKARVGDWIITGVEGEFYPCKPSVFEATHELVEGEARP